MWHIWAWGLSYCKVMIKIMFCCIVYTVLCRNAFQLNPQTDYFRTHKDSLTFLIWKRLQLKRRVYPVCGLCESHKNRKILNICIIPRLCEIIDILLPYLWMESSHLSDFLHTASWVSYVFLNLKASLYISHTSPSRQYSW